MRSVPTSTSPPSISGACSSRQVQVERAQTSGYVSDRAFDNLAYAAEHTLVLADLINTDEYQKYMEYVAEGIVFFVRPHKDLLKEDGVRAGVTWESVLRIDGMIKLMLEQGRIPYLPIESVAMQERARTVDFVLKRTAGLARGGADRDGGAEGGVDARPRVRARRLAPRTRRLSCVLRRAFGEPGSPRARSGRS